MNTTLFTRQFLIGSFLFFGFLVVNSLGTTNKESVSLEKVESSKNLTQEILASK